MKFFESSTVDCYFGCRVDPLTSGVASNTGWLWSQRVGNLSWSIGCHRMLWMFHMWNFVVLVLLSWIVGCDAEYMIFWMCRAWNIIWLLSICQVCVCFFFSRYVFSFPPKLFGDSQQTPHDTFWFEDAGLSQPHQKEGTSRFTLGGAAREKQQQEVLGRKSNKSLKMNGWKM